MTIAVFVAGLWAGFCVGMMISLWMFKKDPFQ